MALKFKKQGEAGALSVSGKPVTTDQAGVNYTNLIREAAAGQQRNLSQTPYNNMMAMIPGQTVSALNAARGFSSGMQGADATRMMQQGQQQAMSQGAQMAGQISRNWGDANAQYQDANRQRYLEALGQEAAAQQQQDLFNASQRQGMDMNLLALKAQQPRQKSTWEKIMQGVGWGADTVGKLVGVGTGIARARQ